MVAEDRLHPSSAFHLAGLRPNNHRFGYSRARSSTSAELFQNASELDLRGRLLAVGQYLQAVSYLARRNSRIIALIGANADGKWVY